MALFKKIQIDQLKHQANEFFSRAIDQHITLAVTGLSRSGKTAFITSLVNQLINEGNGTRLSFFDPVHQGRFIAAKRIPQKNFHVPRFDYDSAMLALTQDIAQWPEPTHGISELRLAIRYQPSSLLKYTTDTATLTIDITDYPGEWLLDLPMLKQSYKDWSAQTHALLSSAPRKEYSQVFLAKLNNIDPFSPVSEEILAELAQEYTELLHLFRHQLGLSIIQPGRFILPGELAGAPILEFFPLPHLTEIADTDYQNAGDDSFIGMLHSRYKQYKEQVVGKFYREHFIRFDRQIVLADCLTALNKGKESFADLEKAINMILENYHYGKSGMFSRLFAPKIDKLLFAATKADHVTPEQHAPLVSLVNELIYKSHHQLKYEAVELKTLAIASVKVTQAGKISHQGQQIPVIQGQRIVATEPKNSPAVEDVVQGNTSAGSAEKVTVFPGDVPETLPNEEYWQKSAFNFINFSPPNTLTKHQSLPHIRLDQVLQFLLADKML